MEVRRTPQTRVDTGQLGYGRASTVDASPIAKGLADLGTSFQEIEAKQREEDLQRQQFDLNKALLVERQRMSEDFVARQTDSNRPVGSFANDVDVDYKTAHEAQLNNFYDQGYDTELLEQTAAKMGELRNAYFEKGLVFQAEQLRARALDATSDVVTRTSQVVASDPAAYADMVEFGRQTIMQNPDLTESERLAALDGLEKAARGAGAKAISSLQPDYVLEKLDPQGLWRASQEVAVTAGAAPGKYVAQSGSWQSVPVAVAEALGLDAAEVAAVMSFETGGTFDPKIMGGDGGKYLGLIQFGQNEQRQYGITQNSTPEQWTAAITKFMGDRGFKPGMGIEDFYSTILTGGPGRHDRKDSNGTSVRNAVPRILAEHKENADKWLASGGVQRIEVPPSTAGQPAPVELPVGEQQRAFNPSDALTGDPLLDSMTGEERIQALGWALEGKRQQSAADKARLDVAIANVKAEALANGEVASAVPSDEEILRVYGPVRGEQIISEVQQTLRVGGSIQKFRTMSDAGISGQLAQLEPQPGSPTYATDLQIYQAAQQAADQLLKEREDDPAAYALKYFPSVGRAAGQGEKAYYAALDRAFETLGIDPQEVAPLPKKSISKIGDDWGLKQPREKIQFFQDNFSTMGEDRFQKLVRELKGTPAEKEARIFALLRTTTSASTFSRILEGMEVIRKDPARRPNFNELRTQFRQNVSTALGNLNADTSAAIQEAASAYYVINGGDPTVIDSDLYEESLRIAMGNRKVADLTKGGWFGENVPDQTILPPGVSEKKFENWVETRQPRDFTNLSVEKLPPVYGDLRTEVGLQEIIDYGVFVMTSPDHYMIKMENDGKPLKTRTGRTFIVRIPKGTIK